MPEVLGLVDFFLIFDEAIPFFGVPASAHFERGLVRKQIFVKLSAATS